MYRYLPHVIVLLGICGNIYRVTGQPSCANPLFSNYVIPAALVDDGGGDITLNIATAAPAPFPPTHSVCGIFTGQNTCCNSDTLQQISRADAYNNNIITVAANSFFQEIITDMEGVIPAGVLNPMAGSFSQQCAQNAMFTPTTCSQLSTQMDTVNSLNQKLIADSKVCMQALNNYTTGMMCLACSSQWPNYVNPANNTVNLNTHTCSTLVAACASLNADFVSLFSQYAAIMKTVVTAGPPLQSSGISTINNDGIFGSSSVPTTTTTTTTTTTSTTASTTLSTTTSTSTASKTSSASSINIAAGIAAANQILAYPDLCGGNITNPGACYGYICSEWVMGLEVNSPQANYVHAMNLRRLQRRGNSDPKLDSDISSLDDVRKLSSMFTNDYSAAGYDPMCADGTACNVAGNAVGGLILDGAGMAGVVVGAFAIVVVAGILIVVIKRRRGSHYQMPANSTASKV